MINLFEGADLGLHVCPLEAHIGALVAHLVAVVGRTEHCQNSASLLVLETFWLHFVTSYKHC